ncbi:MAG: acyl-CoA dehydrogenase family protein [Gammaproteobacteria bacterium]|nr:acyl-CoA dehydrogenase family protein [Gammaproteobacteria bacterium]MBI5619291.1 acyl-CoA dehydrogenase family protein [Gammaproteobacteria bacterium]
MIARTLFTPEHAQFRDAVRKFFARELVPNLARWDAQGMVDKAFWRRCGEQGLLCPDMPEEYGGAGLDFRANAIVLEETSYTGSPTPAFGVHSDIVAHYLLKYAAEEIRRTWIPRMADGTAIGCICMTEPAGGSDLKALRTTARRDGDHWRIDGSKTFITNGATADLAIIAARTGAEPGAKGISLFFCETDRPGYHVGRKLDKVGQPSSDVTEVFFEDLLVPAHYLLGIENAGFAHMMQELPQERLSIAVSAHAAAQRAWDITVEYVKQRQAFGGTLLDFQNTRFVLADLRAKLQVGWAHLDACIMALVGKQLTTDEAAGAKLWHTELRCEVTDACVQLFGGYGYMNEYEIARLWKDARIQRIYGGSSEIMKELISRAI